MHCLNTIYIIVDIFWSHYKTVKDEANEDGNHDLKNLIRHFSAGLLRLEGPVFMRRPGSLLKSPSVDSESSDPSLQQINRHFPLQCFERRQLMAARYR